MSSIESNVNVNSKRNIMIGSAVVVVLILLFVGGYFLLRKKPEETKPDNNPPTPAIPTPWNADTTKTIKDLITTTPIFKCPTNYPSIIDCLVNLIVSKYTFDNANTMLTNSTFTEDDMNNFMTCINQPCMTEIFKSENPTIPDACVACIISGAIANSSGDIVAAAKILHNYGDDFTSIRDNCLNVIKCVPSSTPVNPPSGGGGGGGGGTDVSWSISNKNTIRSMLRNKPIITSCPNSNSSMIDCLVNSIATKYTFTDAKAMLGNVSLSDEDSAYLMAACMNKTCVVETVKTANPTLSDLCISCMVDAAMTQSNNDVVAAATLLNNTGSNDFTDLQSKCTACGAGGVTPPVVTPPIVPGVIAIDGILGPWTPVDGLVECGKACYNTIKQTRICTPPSGGGKPCVGELTQEFTCPVDPNCNVDALVGTYSTKTKWGLFESQNLKIEKKDAKTITISITAPNTEYIGAHLLISGEALYPEAVPGTTNIGKKYSTMAAVRFVNNPSAQLALLVFDPVARTITLSNSNGFGAGEDKAYNLTFTKGDLLPEMTPVDGILGPWTPADLDCNKACYGPLKQTRICTPPKGGGKECIGDLSRDFTCPTDPNCIVDALVGTYSTKTKWGLFESQNLKLEKKDAKTMTIFITAPNTEYVGNHPLITGEALYPEAIPGSTSGGKYVTMAGVRFVNNPNPQLMLIVFDPTSKSLTLTNGQGFGSGQNYSLKFDKGDLLPEGKLPGAIDGGWTDWLPAVSDCAKACYDTITQTRTCTNPAPSGGGKACVGNASQPYKCPADANCNMNTLFGEYNTAMPWGAFKTQNLSVSVDPNNSKNIYLKLTAPGTEFANKNFIVASGLYPQTLVKSYSGTDSKYVTMLSCLFYNNPNPQSLLMEYYPLTKTIRLTNVNGFGGGQLYDITFTLGQGKTPAAPAAPTTGYKAFNLFGDWKAQSNFAIPGGVFVPQTLQITPIGEDAKNITLTLFAPGNVISGTNRLVTAGGPAPPQIPDAQGRYNTVLNALLFNRPSPQPLQLSFDEKNGTLSVISNNGFGTGIPFNVVYTK